MQQPLIPPSKRKIRKGRFIVLGVILLVALVGCSGSETGSSTSTPITQTTQQATIAPTTKPTPIPTEQPTQGLVATHGTPRLGGPIPDFSGKYGSPSNTNRNDAFWSLNSDGSLTIEVRDTGGGKVGYLAIVVPDNWGQQQIQSFALGFAPQGYTFDQSSVPYNASGLYVYDSPSIKFALHLSQGSCYMNTLP